MDFLNELNQAQQEAVTFCDGPSLVIAGAGSGKTRVLTYKIAYLLSKGVQPYRILALTFTNKAAKEMRDRIDLLLGNDISRSIWMNTFHSIFARFLRKEAEFIGFKQNFTIYDAADSKNMVKSIIEQFGLNKEKYDYKFLSNRISTLKNQLILPNAYENYADLIEQDKAMKTPMFPKIYQIYMKQCKDANVMDFDDLLLYTNILFSKHPEVLEKYQNLFQYILVDEYQDTNFSQYLIIKKLAQKDQKLCVVGDDAQSIYSFRGARIENILSFQKDYPNYKLFKLEQNYRSTKNIVNLANSLIEKNLNRIPKNIFSEKEDGSKITYQTLDTDRVEGFFVAETIKTMALTEHFNWSGFAVLYRANYMSRTIEEALRSQNIPYKVWGGLSFYDRAEIKDVIAYIRLCVNNLDIEAFKRIVNYPSRKIGSVSIAKVLIYAVENNMSVWDLITNINNIPIDINSGTKKKLLDFANLIHSFSEKMDTLSAFDFITTLVETTGIKEDLYSDKTPEGVSRYENMEELLNGVRSFCDDPLIQSAEELNFKTISQYLEHISLLTNNEEEKDEKGEKVTLMTIHSAKGLEFNNVFIIGLDEGKFPNSRVLESESAIEEERRLFYVAITRAKQNLFITNSKMGFRYGAMEFNSESRFIRDLDFNFLSQKVKKSNPFAKNDPFDVDYIDFSHNNFSQTVKPKQKITFDTKQEVKPSFKPKPTVNFSPQKDVNTTKINTTPISDLEVGQRVRHEQFGIGEVLEIQADRVKIDFNNQIKTLLLKFAKLEKID